MLRSYGSLPGRDVGLVTGRLILALMLAAVSLGNIGARCVGGSEFGAVQSSRRTRSSPPASPVPAPRPPPSPSRGARSTTRSRSSSTTSSRTSPSICSPSRRSSLLANGTADPAFTNFGLAWYQSDIQADATGHADVTIKTILLDQIFGFDPAVSLAPTIPSMSGSGSTTRRTRWRAGSMHGPRRRSTANTTPGRWR